MEATIMNRIFRCVLTILVLCFMCVPTAQAGLFTAAGKEVAKSIAKQAAKETSEKAAEKVAAGLLRRTANKELQTFLKRYGDDAVRVFASPKRLELVDDLGEPAMKALIKHGGSAEVVLEKVPSHEAVAMLNRIGKEDARRMAIALGKGELPASKAAACCRFVARHPVAISACAVGGYAAWKLVVFVEEHEWPQKPLEVVMQHPWAVVGVGVGFILCLISLLHSLKKRFLKLLLSVFLRKKEPVKE